MKKSQCEQVLEYMKKHNGITTLDAFRDLGVARLSARIKDLKNEGHVIFADMVERPNRSGDMCRVALYTLIKEAEA